MGVTSSCVSGSLTMIACPPPPCELFCPMPDLREELPAMREERMFDCRTRGEEERGGEERKEKGKGMAKGGEGKEWE